MKAQLNMHKSNDNKMYPSKFKWLNLNIKNSIQQSQSDLRYLSLVKTVVWRRMESPLIRKLIHTKNLFLQDGLFDAIQIKLWKKLFEKSLFYYSCQVNWTATNDKEKDWEREERETDRETQIERSRESEKWRQEIKQQKTPTYTQKNKPSHSNMSSKNDTELQKAPETLFWNMIETKTIQKHWDRYWYSKGIQRARDSNGNINRNQE